MKVIIRLFPFVPRLYWDEIIAYKVINICLMGLAELESAHNPIHFPVLDELGACLMETEGYFFFDTFPSYF